MDTTSQVMLAYRRGTFAISAALYPALGIVFRSVEPGALDPWELRLAVASVLLSAVAASYFAPVFIEWFEGVGDVISYLVTVHCWFLLFVNEASFTYAFGFLVVMTAVGGRFSTPLKSAIYLALASAGGLAFALTETSRQVNGWVFAACIGTLSGVLYLMRARTLALIARLNASEVQRSLMALYDPVTHLANQNLFQDRLEHALIRARRNRRQLALFIIDLDDLRAFRKSLSGADGDELLEVLGRRLSEGVRGADSVGRTGTSEFAVILEDIANPVGVAQVARNVLDAVSGPLPLGDSQVQLGANVGISLYPNHGTSVADLVKRARLALFQAKAAGHSNFKFWSPGDKPDSEDDHKNETAH